MGDSNSIIMLLFFFIILAALFLLPRWRIARASDQVIELLLKHGARSPSSAKSKEELGLQDRAAFGGGLFGQRDYRPLALAALIKKGVVKQTEEGKLYLSEEAFITRQMK